MTLTLKGLWEEYLEQGPLDWSSYWIIGTLLKA